MTNNEAKFVLGAYRANGSDAEDATFGAALAQVKTDPALGAWFARAQAHDAAMAGKLREIAPPAGLHEAILAGARASRAPRAERRFPAGWLALAASVAVLLAATLALWPKHAAAGTAQLAAFAMADAAHPEKHGSHGDAVGGLQAMMSEPTTRLSGTLPVDFAALRTTGCRTLNFAGRDVLELCFKRDGAWFHCYIVNNADFPAMANDTATDFEQQAGFGSASWSDGVHRFVVVSNAGLDAVKRLL